MITEVTFVRAVWRIRWDNLNRRYFKLINAISDPSRLGMDSSRIKKVDAWMQRYVDDGKFPGSSVLIARRGQIVRLSSIGQRSLEDDLNFDTDTIVRIYSMTKPIASVAVMMLVCDGLIHLDAPIERYLPEFSNPVALVDGAQSVTDVEPCRAPTVHHLLTHTSGLTYSFNPGLLGAHYAEQKIGFNPRAGGLAPMVQRLAELPLGFKPGTRWEYSVGIDVIGRLIEVVSGQTLDVFLRERILSPLGMNDTAFGVSSHMRNRFANCYVFHPDEAMRLCDAAATSEFLEEGVDTISGGGGLVSTLADYFRFAEMIRHGGTLDGVRILPPKIMAYMMRNHLPGDIASMGPASFAEMPMQGVGFGIGGATVLDPALAHVPGSAGDFGWGGMASTFFWVDPQEALTVIFFTQLIPSSTYPNRAELKALIHSAIID